MNKTKTTTYEHAPEKDEKFDLAALRQFVADTMDWDGGTRVLSRQEGRADCRNVGSMKLVRMERGKPEPDPTGSWLTWAGSRVEKKRLGADDDLIALEWHPGRILILRHELPALQAQIVEKLQHPSAELWVIIDTPGGSKNTELNRGGAETLRERLIALKLWDWRPRERDLMYPLPVPADPRRDSDTYLIRVTPDGDIRVSPHVILPALRNSITDRLRGVVVTVGTATGTLHDLTKGDARYLRQQLVAAGSWRTDDA